MTLTQWFIFFIIVQLIHGLGTWKLYVKAGKKAWEAFVPVYNAVVLMQIINRPWWWTLLLFLPIVNLIMFPVIWVELARSFGKNSTMDGFLAILTFGFYNYYLNYIAQPDYVINRSLKPTTILGDWVSSILFAIVVATIVHTYFIQPFTIPTSSLEKSLLVGDFLFVSKFNYGARLPKTTLALPMVHDTVPFLKKKSYLVDDDPKTKDESLLNKLQFPYLRLPGFQEIKRNDIVVFNWPVDTVQQFFKTPDRSYYKPYDKKSNYVKRCVGLPGDSLEVRDGYVYINGEKNTLPDRSVLQFSYFVQPKSVQFNPNQLYKRYDLTDQFLIINDQNTYYFSSISDDAIEDFKKHPNVLSVTKNIQKQGERDPSIFPSDPNYNWNNDFMGPLYIPKAGATVALNLNTLPLYKRVITAYEGNTLHVKGNQILINNTPVTTYTFKQDYYWMMGDNRHNSEDARSWGFVPFDHVVGKPVFIWMSWDSNASGFDKIRWERVFTTVHGSGKRTSYLIPFLVLILGWFIFNAWRKRKTA